MGADEVERTAAKYPSNLIEYVCVVSHPVTDESAVTIHQGHWAYCASGGAGKHTWEQITPTLLAEIQRKRRTVTPPAASL